MTEMAAVTIDASRTADPGLGGPFPARTGRRGPVPGGRAATPGRPVLAVGNDGSARRTRSAGIITMRLCVTLCAYRVFPGRGSFGFKSQDARGGGCAAHSVVPVSPRPRKGEAHNRYDQQD